MASNISKFIQKTNYCNVFITQSLHKASILDSLIGTQFSHVFPLYHLLSELLFMHSITVRLLIFFFGYCILLLIKLFIIVCDLFCCHPLFLFIGKSWNIGIMYFRWRRNYDVIYYRFFL